MANNDERTAHAAYNSFAIELMFKTPDGVQWAMSRIPANGYVQFERMPKRVWIGEEHAQQFSRVSWNSDTGCVFYKPTVHVATVDR